MAAEKNEIDKLNENMMTSSDELVANIKTVMPNSQTKFMVMIHESNVTNLKKIKDFLNK